MSSGGTESAPTLVVGLGNPILGDDAVGWRVVDSLEIRLERDRRLRDAVGPVQLDRLAVGGLSLMERLVGYGRVVLVDGATDHLLPGTVWSGSLDALSVHAPEHFDSIHDTTLPRALELGRAIGAALPHEIWVVTVSIGLLAEFSDELSEPVEAAVPHAVDQVIHFLAAATAAAR